MYSNKDTLQATLEELFNKCQTVPRIKQEFLQVDEIAEVVSAHEIDYDFAITLLAQMAIHRRCKVDVLVGVLRSHYDDTQRTADEIRKCMEAGLVTYDDNFKVFITIAEPSKETQEQLSLFQYPLPMVVPPETIKDNSSNGYRIFNRGSVILKDNHHDDDVCLDHLNRVNKIKLAINGEVMQMIQNKWRNLDKPKDGETLTEYRKRLKAFEKYDEVSRQVMGLLLSEGNELYLTHKYDKRGRTYCQGYSLNYQGTPWNKSVIEFANKELI
jgi:hypothetical protein